MAVLRVVWWSWAHNYSGNGGGGGPVASPGGFPPTAGGGGGGQLYLSVLVPYGWRRWSPVVQVLVVVTKVVEWWCYTKW